MSAPAFTPEEIEILHGLVGAALRDLARYLASENEEGARLFYGQRLDQMNAINAKFEARLIADTSQDAKDEDGEQ